MSSSSLANPNLNEDEVSIVKAIGFSRVAALTDKRHSSTAVPGRAVSRHTVTTLARLSRTGLVRTPDLKSCALILTSCLVTARSAFEGLFLEIRNCCHSTSAKSNISKRLKQDEQDGDVHITNMEPISITGFKHPLLEESSYSMRNHAITLSDSTDE